MEIGIYSMTINVDLKQLS